MVLELAPTDRESFLKKIALESKAAPADTPSSSAPETNKSDTRPLVALDPGHGGPDTGTKGPAGNWRKISSSTSLSGCGIASRRPANTAS